MRVLVVEDDRLLAEGLVRQLEKAGFSVDHTPSAREATVLGEQEDYRAVILDLGLPDGNGLEVLKRIRNCGIPHIAKIPVPRARDRRLYARCARQNARKDPEHSFNTPGHSLNTPGKALNTSSRG